MNVRRGKGGQDRGGDDGEERECFGCVHGLVWCGRQWCCERGLYGLDAVDSVQAHAVRAVTVVYDHMKRRDLPC